MQEINGTIGIIILLIGILFLFVILVLGSKIQVQNKEIIGKDILILQWKKDYKELYNLGIEDLTKLQQKLIVKENQIDKLEEVINNLEKNVQPNKNTK